MYHEIMLRHVVCHNYHGILLEIKHNKPSLSVLQCKRVALSIPHGEGITVSILHREGVALFIPHGDGIVLSIPRGDGVALSIPHGDPFHTEREWHYPFHMKEWFALYTTKGIVTTLILFGHNKPSLVAESIVKQDVSVDIYIYKHMS